MGVSILLKFKRNSVSLTFIIWRATLSQMLPRLDYIIFLLTYKNYFKSCVTLKFQSNKSTTVIKMFGKHLSPEIELDLRYK